MKDPVAAVAWVRSLAREFPHASGAVGGGSGEVEDNSPGLSNFCISCEQRQFAFVLDSLFKDVCILNSLE